jgi:6-phosphogluconolactonase
MKSLSITRRILLTLAGVVAGLLTARPALSEGDAPKSFVYVITNPDGPNAVEAYSRDGRTGRISHIARYPTGGTGYSLVGGFEQNSLVSDGDFLYAVNPGSDTISAFAVRKDGSLRLLGQVPSGGRLPVSLALNKGLVYVANEGNVPGDDPEQGSYSGFTVGKYGRLKPLPGSTVLLNPGDSPADVAFGRNGEVLVGTRLPGNLIDSFRVGRRGHLTHQRTIPGGGGPFGALFTGPSQLLVTLGVPEMFPDEQAPGLASYRVSALGRLVQADAYTDPDTSDAGLRDPCWLTSTPDGNYVWVSSFIPRMLTLFRVDGRGALTRLSSYNPGDSEQVPDPENPSGPPVTVVVGSTDVATSKDGRYLYQLRAFAVPDGAIPAVPRIEVLRVTGDWNTDAGLSPAQTVPLPEDLAPTGVMGLVIVERGGR